MAQTFTNRLINETSPYLLEHAENPVDWFPWGNEAFEKAKAEDKPVFVSIGYSSCHWCHVMAHESFEDPQIAAVLNSYFVSIKVDREERPDIDSVYMDFAQAMTGSGGWPLSIFMTPDKKPFFCGTYFPPKDIGDRPGFAGLLMALHDVWVDRRDEINKVSDESVIQLSEIVPGQSIPVTETMLFEAYDDLERTFDSQFGGFGRAPKFPQPSLLSFLLTFNVRSGRGKALQMVEKTLEAMVRGGIHDLLGGGFHRYAVDGQWRVPHFEKMLYDQALISKACIQTFQLTGKQDYAQLAKSIFDYVLRDLTYPAGGFYSSEDADTEGQEGRFYLWDYDEIITALGPQDGYLFAVCCGVTPDGNFETRNILYTSKSAQQAAEIVGISVEEVEKSLKASRQRLFELRNERPRPRRDEKVIAGWNGLMISALARGGAVLNEQRYLTAAQQAAHMILQSLIHEARLRRSFADGKAEQPAFLEDYAFMAKACFDLYQADFDPQWLSEGLALADQMIDLFEDNKNGGFYFTGKDSEELVLRQKPYSDAAIPSGNSAAIMMLMEASALSGRTGYFEHAQKALKCFGLQLVQQRIGMAEMLVALDYYLGPRQEVVIAGQREDHKTKEFIKAFNSSFLPRSVIMLRTQDTREALLDEINPSIKEQGLVDNMPAAYVCEKYVCKEPTTYPEKLKNALKHLK